MSYESQQQYGNFSQPPQSSQPGQGGPYGHAGPQPLSGDPGTLDLPYYGIGFVDAVKRAFAKYVRFDGRASRSEFWWFTLFAGVISTILYIPVSIPIADGNFGDVGGVTILFGIAYLLFLLAIFLPGLGVTIRRLHDQNRSGWLYLLNLIPWVGSIILLVLLAMPGTPEGARYDRAHGGR